MTTTTLSRQTHEHSQSEPVYEHQRIVRRRYPRARLRAVYDEGGAFRAWRIVNGDGGVRLSGEFACDEAAWQNAAMRCEQ